MSKALFGRFGLADPFKFAVGKKLLRLRMIVSFVRICSALIDLLALGLLALLANAISKSEFDFSENMTFEIPGFSNVSFGLSIVTMSLTVLLLFASKNMMALVLTWLHGRLVADSEARLAAHLADQNVGHEVQKYEARLINKSSFQNAIVTGISSYGHFLNSRLVAVAESFSILIICLALSLASPGAFISVLLTSSVVVLLVSLISKLRLSQKAGVAARATEKLLRDSADAHELSLELYVSGGLGLWSHSLGNDRRILGRANASIFLLNTLPRYVIEVAIFFGLFGLLLTQYIGVGTLNPSDISVFLAGGLRLAGSLVPLQTALQRVSEAKTKISVSGLLDSAGGGGALSQMKETSWNSISGTASDHEVHDIVLRVALPTGFQLREWSSGKIFHGDVILVDESAQRVLISGSSGLGKSRLLAQLIGKASSSEKAWISSREASMFIRSHPGRVGFVPQTPHLLAGDVMLNLTLGINKAGVTQEAAIRALEMVGLHSLVGLLGNDSTDLKLSGGEKLRLGLARALIQQPSILLIDEPISALDGDNSEKIEKLLDSLQIPMVIVSHQPLERIRLDRRLILENR